MRKSAFAWLALAALCGTVLFHTSQQVNAGRGRLAELERLMAEEKESLRVLAAEWSYLNQPARLEALSRSHLDLRPVSGAQFVSADTLAAIEPAAGGGKDAFSASRPVPPAPVAAAPAVAAKKIPRPVPRPARRVAPPRPPAGPAPAAPAPRGFDDLLKSLGVAE